MSETLLIDWALPFLKFVSIVLSGLFGMLALLVQYRDEAGKITRWGRIALVGVLASAATTGATTSVELLKGSTEAARTAKQTLEQSLKTARVINDINRALHPLKDLEFTFFTDVSLQRKELEDYRMRLSREVETFVNTLKGDPGLSDRGLFVSDRGLFVGAAGGPGRRPQAISIPLSSPAFPNKHTEQAAYYLLRYVDYTLAIFRQPIRPDIFTVESRWPESQPRPDLEIPISTSDLEDGLSINYDLDSKQISVNAHSIKSDPRRWSGNKGIVSTLDLAGSQLFLFTRSTVVPMLNSDKDNNTLLAVRRELSLKALVINVAGGITFWFPNRGNVKGFSDSRGLKYLVFDVPSNIDELRN